MINPNNYKTMSEFMNVAVVELLKTHECRTLVQAYSKCQNIWLKKDNKKNVKP